MILHTSQCARSGVKWAAWVQCFNNMRFCIRMWSCSYWLKQSKLVCTCLSSKIFLSSHCCVHIECKGSFLMCLPTILGEKIRRGARLGGWVISQNAIARLTTAAPISFCPLKMTLHFKIARSLTNFPEALMILELIWIVLGHQDDTFGST